jgi:hypothetical protein
VKREQNTNAPMKMINALIILAIKKKTKKHVGK